MRCPNCNNEIFDQLSVCPYCGKIQNKNSNNNDEEKKDNKSLIISIIIPILIILALVFFFAFFSNNKKSNNEENAERNVTDDNKDTKYVGTDEFGYVKVPNNWIRYYESEDQKYYQYSDESKLYIVTLNASNKANAYDYIMAVYDKLDTDELQDLYVAKTKLGNNEAYMLSGIYSNNERAIIIFTLDDKNGNAHYISLEGDLEIANYSYILESFVLNK